MSSPLTAGGCPPAAYPVLVPVSRGCPGLRGQVAYVLLTRSPLAALSRRANDLHVLGTPPAFVLSQDQTLRLSLSLSLKYTLRDSLPQDRRLLYVLFLFRLSEIAARRPSAASPYNLPPIAGIVNPFFGFFSKFGQFLCYMRIVKDVLCGSAAFGRKKGIPRGMPFPNPSSFRR